MSASRVLVFPAGMPAALAYSKRARREGRVVLGASSLAHDPARGAYNEWTTLPFVTDPDFTSVLIGAISEFRISYIYTANSVVWSFIDELIQRRLVDVCLVNDHPMREVERMYEESANLSREAIDTNPDLFVRPDRMLPDGKWLSAMYHHLEAIPGMCDHDKTRAITAAFQSAPKGDVVEIGTWWGKSAFLLHQLSRLNKTGPVLCIDPWDLEQIVQNDAAGLVDAVAVDPKRAFEIFVANLLPYAAGDINYIRATSVEAARSYGAGGSVHTPEFGSLSYAGEIAVLHIDGNHSFEAVRDDVAAWLPKVRQGGWVIVDDYLWPYGDGPQLIGDSVLTNDKVSIATSFVQGSALFMKLSD